MNKKLLLGLTGLVAGIGGTIATAILVKKDKKVASKVTGAIAGVAAVAAAAMGVTMLDEDEEEIKQYTLNFDEEDYNDTEGNISDYENQEENEDEYEYEEQEEQEEANIE